MSGAELITAERKRQVEVEGWTPEHDDEHTEGELGIAASGYLYVGLTGNTSRPLGWPWHESWWKPSDDPVRNLVKAGALIAAEIDRLTRARNPVGTDGPTPPTRRRTAAGRPVMGEPAVPLIVKQSGQVTVTSTGPAYVWRCEVCGWLGTGWTSEHGATREAVDHLWKDHGIAACEPGELGPHGFNGHVQHQWEHVKGSDSTDKCVRCGRYCGK